jgi:hypothetical protein
VLSLTVAANAQTFRGAINGTVTDPSGAIVPNAAVKATETATGIDHNAVTTTDGAFSFQDLPLGFYKVTVTASGFPVYTVDKVEVVAGSIYTLAVKLSLQQQSTTVEVSAAALTLDTTTQVQTMTISSNVVQDIPLNGRDFTQLIAVAPGYGGYSVGGFGSLNGTRPNQMNWQIDGVDNNDFWHNIPAVNQGGVSGIAGIVLPIDSIDEFSAQTQSSAEAGRNAGGTVNLVTKSGSNSIHGSAYYYNRNEYYAAKSPFFSPSATVRKAPPLRNENYGFSVGGPMIKNKLFYFASFEKQQYLIGLSGIATEPSDAWIALAQGLLANCANPPSCTTKYGTYAPVTAASFTPNLIGPTGFWPRSGQGSIAALPATNNNYFSPVASTGYSYNGVARVDYQINDKNHLYFRWFGGQGSQTAPLGGSPALGTASSNLAYYFEVAPIHVYNYSLVLNTTLKSNFTNQILVGGNYFNQLFHDNNNSFNTKNMGIFLSPDATNHGQPILGAPNIVIGSFEQIGLTPPEGRYDLTLHFTDIASYVRGKHQMRFGGEFRQGRVNEFYHRRGTGKFTFDGTQGPWSGATGCGVTPPAAVPAGCAALISAATLANAAALADFLAGDVSTCTVPAGQPAKSNCGSTIAVGNPERFVKVNGYNLFFSDSWQVTRKLSLDLGMRYEYFGPLHSDNKDLPVYVVGQGLLVQGNGISNIFPPDKNNFAPRFGFAYQPTGNGDLVVRGGIGVFYDQINMNPFLDFRPPITAAQGLQGNPIGASPVSTLSRDNYNWGTGAGQAQFGGASIFPGVIACTNPTCTNAPGLNVYSVAQNFRTPYFFNYSLQVEKSFGNSVVWQVGYVGSQGRKLNIMLNLPTTGTNFNNIIQLNSIGTSNYNALQTTLKIRSWHGLTSQVSYTYGHSLDEISEYRAAIADGLNPKATDYGNSDYDTRHLFTVGINYSIPNGGWANGWKKYIFHDWQLASLWNLHSGQPWDITLSGLNLIGDPFAGTSHSFTKAIPGAQWINPAAFCAAGFAGCPGTALGDVARNKFYGPNFRDVDFSVIKNIPVTERVKIQLRAEMYNLFNRINFASGPGSVSTSCNAPIQGNPALPPTLANTRCNLGKGFGQVTDTIGDFNGAPGLGPGEPFNMQLVAKIIF